MKSYLICLVVFLVGFEAASVKSRKLNEILREHQAKESLVKTSIEKSIVNSTDLPLLKVNNHAVEYSTSFASYNPCEMGNGETEPGNIICDRRNAICAVINTWMIKCVQCKKGFQGDPSRGCSEVSSFTDATTTYYDNPCYNYINGATGNDVCRSKGASCDYDPYNRRKYICRCYHSGKQLLPGRTCYENSVSTDNYETTTIEMVKFSDPDNNPCYDYENGTSGNWECQYRGGWCSPDPYYPRNFICHCDSGQVVEHGRHCYANIESTTETAYNHPCHEYTNGTNGNAVCSDRGGRCIIHPYNPRDYLCRCFSGETIKPDMFCYDKDDAKIELQIVMKADAAHINKPALIKRLISLLNDKN